MTARRTVAVLVAAALLAPAVCTHHGPDDGEAHLEVDGRARVERVDGSHETVDDSADLARGDRVEVTEGIAKMELAHGVRFELRKGLAEADNSVVRMDDQPELEAGELLVSVPGDEPFTVDSAGTSVAVGNGSARLARTLGVGVASYGAAVHLDSAGQKRTVQGLRQMQVPALGRPPQAPQPIVYARTDPWDQRYLGEAIDVDRSVARVENGYTPNLRAGQGRSVGYFKQVYPGLAAQPAFDATLLDERRDPGELLIGAAIAQLGQKGSFVDRWDDVFAFKDDGATWGIVALDQAVRSKPLLDAIDQALLGAPVGFTSQPGDELASPPTTQPTTPTTQEPGPEPTTPPPGTTPTTAPPPTTPVTTPPPVTVPPITVPSSPLDPVVEPVVDLVNGLVGGLLGGRP